MSIPTVVAFHYTLKDKDGNEIDSSAGGDPLYVMLGKGHIVKGLDTVLPDMKVGDKKTVVVSPDDGYGPVNDELRLRVPRGQFPPEADLQLGICLLYTSPSPRDGLLSRMPSSA